MVNGSHYDSSDDESAYELIDTLPLTSDHSPIVEKRDDPLLSQPLSSKSDAPKNSPYDFLVASKSTPVPDTTDASLKISTFKANVDNLVSRIREELREKQEVLRTEIQMIRTGDEKVLMEMKKDKTIMELEKKLLEAQQNSKEQLQKKDEELAELKKNLEGKEGMNRHLSTENEKLNNTVVDLEKKLLIAEHSREDQLWMKNEKIFYLTMLLEQHEEHNQDLRAEIKNLRARIINKSSTAVKKGVKKAVNEFGKKQKRSSPLGLEEAPVNDVKALAEKTDSSVDIESRIVYLSKKGGNDLGLVVNITEDSSVIVSQVNPGGTSGQMGGMEEGDEIVSVNGRRLKGDSIHSDYDFIMKLQGKIILEVRKNPEKALLPKTQYAL